MRKLVVSLCVLALLVAGLWYAAPALLTHTVPTLAVRYGVQDLQLAVELVERNKLIARNVAFQYGDTAVQIAELQLAYEPLGMLSGQLPRIDLREVELAVATPAGAADDEVATQPLEILDLLARLPDVTARPIRLRVEDLGFSATGEFMHRDGTVQFGLTAGQPSEVAGMVLRGDVMASGLVTLAWLDPGRSTGPLATVRSRVSDARVEMEADFELSGYPLALASRVSGLPAGAGKLQGMATIVLPTPVQQVRDLTYHGQVLVDWRAADGSIVAEGLALVVEGDWQSTRVTTDGGRVTVPDAPATVLTPAGLTFERHGTRVELSTGRAPFSAGGDDLRIAGHVVSARLEASESGLNAAVELDLGGYRLPLDVAIRTASGATAITSTGTLRVRKPLLAALLDSWREPLDVVGGELAYEFSLDRATTLEGHAAMELRGVDILWDRDVLNGVSGHVEVELSAAGIKLRPSRITAAGADVGVQLRDIVATLSYDQRAHKLTVEDAHLGLLGGSATAERIDYDAAGDHASFRVKIVGMDLAEILALEGESLKGTGTLNGTLPLTWMSDGIRMQRGLIQAVGEGDIRLAPSLARVTGQPGLDFATQALTDFHYDTLSAEADFAANGELALAVKLHGRNPAVEKGRAIHYNLNITENVYDLLESLRAQRTVTDSVTRKVTNQ